MTATPHAGHEPTPEQPDRAEAVAKVGELLRKHHLTMLTTVDDTGAW